MLKTQRTVFAIVVAHLVLLQWVNPSITVRDAKVHETETLTSYGWPVRWLEKSSLTVAPGFGWSVDWVKLAGVVDYSLVGIYVTRYLLLRMETEISEAYSRKV